MTKIKYIGDISPARVKVGNSFLKGFKTGDILDVGEEYAEKLVQTGKYERVSGGKKKSSKEEESDKKEDLDLDGDGDVDEDDASIAGKTLAEVKKQKNKSKKEEE